MFLSFFFFILFFITAVATVVAFVYLYAKVTPYDDYDLIFKKNNTAAAISFGGAIVGLSIPLYSALVSSVSYFEFIFWAIIAMGIQLGFAYLLTRAANRYSFKQQIDDGVVSVGLLMAFLSISMGLLNAGSMSY